MISASLSISRRLTRLPSETAIAERYGRSEPQVVWTTLVADLETPVSAFLKLGAKSMSFLLESVEGGAVRGRYSIIGLDPDLIWRTNNGKAEINRSARANRDAFSPCPEPPLQALRALIAESRITLPEDLPPMAAGVFGYLGYDMVRLMEELAPPNPDPIGIPDAILVRPTIIVVFDAVKDSITVVTPVRPEKDVDARTALTRATERLIRVADSLEGPPEKSASESGTGPTDIPARSNTTPEEFKTMVRKAKEYIVAGDAFQVVLAQRFEAPFTLPPFSLYRALRRTNPSPYLYFLDFGAFAVAGSSPEILVKVSEDVVTIRPIAGTRHRGATPSEDKALAEELLADPKERAEHLMLLDLGRNDVGRVAAVGTVTVTDQFFIERYSHVMHIVSNVEEKRGLYAGCVGYFSAAGEMDTCIVLRTALIKDGTMYVQAGAGVVADSDPDFEQQECINKAKALFRAAEEARRFASAAKRGQ